MKSKFYMTAVIFIALQFTNIGSLKGQQDIDKFIYGRRKAVVSKESLRNLKNYTNSTAYDEDRKREKLQEEYRKAQEELKRQKIQKDLEIIFNKNVEKIKIQNNTYNNLLIQNCGLFVISIVLLGLMVRKSKRLI